MSDFTVVYMASLVLTTDWTYIESRLYWTLEDAMTRYIQERERYGFWWGCDDPGPVEWKTVYIESERETRWTGTRGFFTITITKERVRGVREE